MDQPTQSDLKSLLASIEEVQFKILQTLGPNEQIKKGWAAELEPLKAPVFSCESYLDMERRDNCLNKDQSDNNIAPE